MMEKMYRVAKRRWRKVNLAESHGVTVVGGYYLDLLLWEECAKEEYRNAHSLEWCESYL